MLIIILLYCNSMSYFAFRWSTCFDYVYSWINPASLKENPLQGSTVCFYFTACMQVDDWMSSILQIKAVFNLYFPLKDNTISYRGKLWYFNLESMCIFWVIVLFQCFPLKRRCLPTCIQFAILVGFITYFLVIYFGYFGSRYKQCLQWVK